MKRIKRILALCLAAAMLSLALGAIAEYGAPDAGSVPEVAQKVPQEAEAAEPDGAQAAEEEQASIPEQDPEEAPEEAPEPPEAEGDSAPPAGSDAPADSGFVMDGNTLVVYEGAREDVVVPEGVRVIGPVAFCELPELRSVSIPASVERIESYAFANCENLESVTLSEGLRAIEDHAFQGCARLREIALPEGLLRIGDAAFSDCASLRDVALPASAAIIGESAFPEGALAAEAEALERGALEGIELVEQAEGAGDIGPEEGWQMFASGIGCVEALTIGVKESVTLEVDYVPASEEDVLSYVSENKAIAKVGADGKITGVKKGETTITVSSSTGASAICRVTVKAAPKKASFSPSKGSLGVGQTAKLELTLSKDSASHQIAWKSSNEEVAQVRDGTVTALSVGSAKITATTFNKKKATYTLTVKPAATAVQIPESVKLCVDQRYVPPVTLEPEGAQSDISFASDDEGVLAVEDGALVVKRTGSATITVTVRNGEQSVTAQCAATVVEAPTGIEIIDPVQALGVKESYSFTAALTGDAELGAHNVWSSSKESVLKLVDASRGTFKGVKKGQATVTVTSANGLEASVQVKVLSAPKKVSLSATKGTLGVNETVQLTAKLPKSTASQIRWTTSDDEVAQVEGGAVTALKEGSAKITALTFNNKKAVYKLTVKKAPESVDVLGEVALSVGQSYTLNIALAPADAASKLTIANSNPTAVKVSKQEVTAANKASLKLTALEEGSSTIEIEAYNGQRASCTVTVYPVPTKLEITNAVKSLGVKEEYQLQARNDRDDALMMHAKWKSSNKKIIAVNATTGKLTAKKTGKAKITVTLPKGKSTIKKSVTISVTKGPGSITLDQTSAKLRVGEQLKLTATLPKKTASQIRWSSDDEGVAIVEDGLVTAIGGGEARITASTFNDKSASCTVMVEGMRAPTLRIDGEPVGTELRQVFDDVELSWSCQESVRGYSVRVSSDDGDVLLDWADTLETTATIEKSRMRPGVEYAIELSAEMDVNGETVIRNRTARIMYVEPVDFTYEFGADGATITGYIGSSATVTVPGKLEGRKVTRIAAGAFNGANCASVTQITWPAGVTFEADSVAGLQGCADSNGFLVFDGVLCEYFGKAASITIPEGVLRVNDAAFEGKGSITSVKIPNTVRTIGVRAFADCSKLQTMTRY